MLAVEPLPVPSLRPGASPASPGRGALLFRPTACRFLVQIDHQIADSFNAAADYGPILESSRQVCAIIAPHESERLVASDQCSRDLINRPAA
jgi:hypothetical protein